MNDEARLEARYRRMFGWRAGYLPRDRGALDAWHRELKAQLREEGAGRERNPAVRALEELLAADPIVRMYVSEMIAQVPVGHKNHIKHTDELLEALDRITVTAPLYNADPNKRNAFPMSSLFAYMMMTTAGEAVFRNEAFNEAIRGILQEWCRYLDGPGSAHVLNEGEYGWLSQFAYQDMKLYEFVFDRAAPHWGWTSYNDFFHREIRKEARPIAAPGDPKVIVSANDGNLVTIARGVQRTDTFWLKGEPFSLADMLDRSEYVDRFVGGYVFQSFLSGANYHRWHAPIDGVVRDARIVSSSRSRALRVSDGRALELRARLVEAAELGEEVAAHARQQVVALERRLRGQRVDELEAGRRAERHRDRDRAVQLHDRRRRELGERVVERRDARPVGLLGGAPARGRRRSRPAARTGPSAPPSASARASAARPRRMSSWSQRARSWSSSRTGSPDGPTRARSATPGSPSARRGRGPPARAARARPGCGRGAARPRRARGASSRRRRSPSSPR
jgi:hypothetical protein